MAEPTANGVEVSEKASKEAPSKEASSNALNNNKAAHLLEAEVFEPPPPSDEVQTFGWGKFRPKFLQVFCNAKWALFWLCWGGAMQGLIVNGFINVVITTIERRFGLRSSQTGLVASGYDIASFVFLVPVTYLGGRIGASKPHWVAWGTVVMGVGSLIFAMPHFLVGTYRASTSDPNVCWVDQNATYSEACDGSDDEESESYVWTVWIFFAAQLLHGAGAAPLFTLGVTYIDENVSRKMSSIYLGVYYGMAILGPAMGYLFGGQMLLLYTDFLTVNASEIGLTSQSNVWIGAWWIGFVFAALACFLMAIPMFAYPKSLPGSEELRKERVSEAHNSNPEKPTETFTKFRELPKALLKLVRNPTFSCLNMAAASEGLIVTGFAAFLPKQIESQYSISPVWAALLMGLVTVPAGGGATFVGGWLVKRFKLTCAGIIKMCLAVTIVATCFTMSFLLSCPNMAFAGVTSEYRNPALGAGRSLTGEFNISLDAACNNDCRCDTLTYEPVCGADGLMYYSPCHAGCEVEHTHGGSKTYSNCSCIEPADGWGWDYDAKNSKCESDCNYLPYFMGLCFVMMVFTFLATMPTLSATLRCVDDDQRSLALGVQWVKVRIFGTIPAPLIFGVLIDQTCIMWQDSCDESGGACLFYDNRYLAKYMWILALVAKICSATFFFCAWWFYIPPKHNTEEAAAINSSAETTVDSSDGGDGDGDVDSSAESKQPQVAFVMGSGLKDGGDSSPNVDDQQGTRTPSKDDRGERY